MQQLTLTETIVKVETLIDTGNGDTGRLHHILEFLKCNRDLYYSDQIYLEHKLNSLFSTTVEPTKENTILPKIQQLMDSGNGDIGRLQHIYDMIANEKPLYHSDQVYLETKLQSSIQDTNSILVESSKTKQMYQHTIPPKKEILKEQTKTSKIQGTMPKGWIPTTDSKELGTISKNIIDEEQKLQQKQKISEEINLQRSKLTGLISNRKDYEQKITLKRTSLESQIKDERNKIKTQTKYSKELIIQKDELDVIKKERLNIVKKIDSDKFKIIRELEQQKIQLVKAQTEQEKIVKQIHDEQTLLAKMTNDQKLRLVEQTKIAKDIKSKQTDLEIAKQVYDEIVSQVNDEKAKFVESEKLKKSIKIQEQNLIKAKEDRLGLITLISKEKILITKKTQEEQKKLKSQRELSKHLKTDEKAFELLKKKRKKVEQQIKKQNQKLKEKHQKLKKQIIEKDKKLKSISKKPLQKKTLSKKSPLKKTRKIEK